MISSSDIAGTRHTELMQRKDRAGFAAARLSRRQRRAQAGQSLIIAIAVLFLLAFLAALFITLLSRNLERTQRASDVLTADFYAQAGVRYADQMLTTSPQGADWRPPMHYYLGDTYATLNPDPNTSTTAAKPFTFTGTPTLSAAEQAAYLAYVNDASGTAVLTRINPHDPDKFWLEQGFTRYPAQGGRYLLRITYGSGTAATNDPYQQNNPSTGKFIRIESVGRTGVVDDTNPSDPTVFTGAAQPIRLNATLIAYKPIGLTDYARFITNRDQRSDTFTLGVPSSYNNTGTATTSSIVTPGVADFTSDGGAFDLDPYPLVTSYGTPSTTVGSSGGSGGSLRCNGSLRLYGLNVAFLNSATNGDDWEIAGDLSFDGYNPSATGTAPTALQVVGAANPAATPSNATTFTTVNGLIRDGESGNDQAGYARNIQRLNPPAIDAPAPGDGEVEHYAALTDNGSPATTAEGAGPYVKESANGPATVYIDNTGDEQPESSSAQAGSTLRDDWLNPQANINQYWHGPFYDPPGATIVFGPQYIVANGSTVARWGFTVTRSDTPVGQDAQDHVTWHWNGEPTSTSLTASTCSFVYGAPPTGFTYSATNPVFFINADDVPQSQVTAAAATPSTDNDIVIYAEGNIRVRGTVSPTGAASNGGSDPDQIEDSVTQQKLRASPHHVTLVTNQIAYIEGSLLKGGSFPNGNATGTATSAGLSSIAVLARRYVTVNTTQFLAGAVQHANIANQQVDASPGGTGSSGALDFGADSSLTESFDEPADTETSTPTGVAPPALYLSQYSSGSGTENSSGFLHLVETAFDGTIYTADTTLDGTPVPGPPTAPTLAGSAATPNRTVIALDNNNAFSTELTSNLGTPGSGYDHYDLTFAKSPQSLADYELAKAAILPSDVHIEAVLYAQDNSFFVIPGEWFNDDASDTMTAYAGANNQATTASARSRPYPAGTVEPDGDTSTATGGVTDPAFPMYGQPIDMKITITGSVSENVPADISDQAAWMQHWGWIPKFHGVPFAGLASPHVQLPSGDVTPAVPSGIAQNLPGAGLTFVYDPTETTAPTTNSSYTGYIRLDQYGRPLPFAPNLPVSPDLLYSGQPSGNSLVQ